MANSKNSSRDVVLKTPVWVLRKAELTATVIYCQIIRVTEL